MVKLNKFKKGVVLVKGVVDTFGTMPGRISLKYDINPYGITMSHFPARQ